MDDRLDLKVDVVGRYRWGSLVCDFPLAPATARTAVQAVADWASQTLHFETAAEGRAVLSLMHELVHYLQDLTTGVGHWDYVARHHALPKLRSHVPHSGSNVRQVLKTGPAANTFARLRSDLLFVDAEAAAAREALMVATLKAELGDGAGTPLLSLPSILETEAMACVLIEVLGRSLTPDSDALLSELGSLWNPAKMEATYQDLFAMAFQASGLSEAHGPGGDRLRATAYLIALTTDLALAHPPSRYLHHHSLDPRQFEPGVRFSRIWRALPSLSKGAAATFLAAWQALDLEICERMLLDHVTFPYPTCRATYQAWTEELESLTPGAAEDQVVAVRLAAAKTRATQYPILALKGAPQLVDFQCPFIVRADGETHYVWQGTLAVDKPAQLSYIEDVELWERMNRVIEHYYAGRPFVCGLANGKRCDAAQTACRTGWTALSALPPHAGCLVRRQLGHAELPLT